MEINFKNRDIISITDFSREEILYLCRIKIIVNSKNSMKLKEVSI